MNNTVSLEKRVASLEEENQRLLDEIYLFKSALVKPDWLPPLEFRLTASEGIVLGALMTTDECSKERLHLAVTTKAISEDEITEIKIVDVFICKVRAKLKPFDIKIETIWGRGYSLTAESKSIISEMGR